MVTKNRWFSISQTLSLRSGILLLFATLIALAVSATFFANNAGAQSLGQPVKQPINVQQDCYNRLNDKNFRNSGQWNADLDQFFVRSCINNPSVGGNCLRDNERGVVTCTNPAQQVMDAQKAALKKAYGDALAAKQCGDIPAQGGQQQECRAGFRNITDRCLDSFFANGYDDGSVTFPDINVDVVARCIANPNSSMSLGEASRTLRDTKDKANQDANKAKESLESANTNPPADGAASTCRVEGIGWIICPVTSFMAMIVDGAYVGVSALLTTPPLNTDLNNNPLYSVWASVRTIANVAFAISFLLIIFSYITNVGVSNYGIKKMLPRLIIAAILVNISYWICAIAVDLSNVIGSSVVSLVDGLNIPRQNDPSWWSWTATGVGSDNWQKLAGALLAAGVVGGVASLAGGFAIFLPVIITALLAVATVFVVLIIRQALIILLIVVAPLAFVAYLLPNTENLFKKWLALFRTLLLMFPIIAAIFGLSRLAGQVVMNSSQNIFVQIAGAGITIIPLVITPVVMRAAGGVLNRIGGFINNPNKGPVDRLRKGAASLRKTEVNRGRLQALSSQKARGLGKARSAFYRSSARRDAIAASTERLANNAQSGYIASQAQHNDAYLEQLAGGKAADQSTKNAALAQAISTEAKIEAEEVSAATAIIKNAQLNQDAMLSLARGGSAIDSNGVGNTALNGSDLALRQAAMQQVVAQNNVAGINKLIDDNSGQDVQLQQTLADSLRSSSNRPAYIGQGAIAQIENGDQGVTADKLMETALAQNAYSPAKFAGADKEELKEMNNYLASDRSQNVSTENRNQFQQNARDALTDPRLSPTISKNEEQVLRSAGVSKRDELRIDNNAANTIANAVANGNRNAPQMNIPQNAENRRFSGNRKTDSGIILPDEDKR